MKAIILAAGLSSRMNPLTLKIHKGLLPIANTTIIENQIQLLKETGINDIYIVVGHGEKAFIPIKKRYNVQLIYNPHYADRNNLYSLYLATEHLYDAYVIEGDTYIFKNIFNIKLLESTYFLSFRQGFKKEWVIEEKNNKVSAIDIRGGDGNVIAGISYWTGHEARVLAEYIKKAIEVHKEYQAPWGNAVLNNLLNLKIGIQHLKENTIFEIDTLDDYYKLKNLVSPLNV